MIETQRHREPIANAMLSERGIESYLPRIEIWPRPAVGSAVGPMFPGYLFVCASLQEHGHRILRTNGVKSFVAFGGAPAAVADAAIEFLRGREDADGIVRVVGVGERGAVRVVRGPLRGLEAVVCERLPARERVRILLQLLQRPTEIEVPESWVRRS